MDDGAGKGLTAAAQFASLVTNVNNPDWQFSGVVTGTNIAPVTAGPPGAFIGRGGTPIASVDLSLSIWRPSGARTVRTCTPAR